MTSTWGAGERYTVGAVLEAQAARQPDKVCVWFDDLPVTFGEMQRRATAVGNQLAALGVEPGDSVAIFAENCAEWVDVWLAAAKIGALSVPVNTAFKGDFLAHQLRDSSTKLVFVDREYAPRVVEVAGALPALQTIAVRDPEGKGALDAGRLKVVPAPVLYEGDEATLAAGQEVRWDQPACLFYTSGTTGPSKGVVVTQHYLVTSARTVIDAWQLTPEDVVYGAVPLFHFSGTLGVVLPAIVTGSTSVLDKRFSPAATWERVRKHGATGWVGVGPMLVMLWNLPRDPSDAELPIRFISSAPIPPELHFAIEERYGCKVVTMYGMTESFPLAVMGVGDPGVPGSAGRANPLFDVRIFDDDDNEVPAGGAGEIVCRPLRPHVMFEDYFRRPEATVEQFRNLWFHTGDFGKFDEDGNFYFIDRKKDAIRRRGENISSFEVERTVMGHPAVAEAAAHAVPSEVGEDDVKICVIVKPDAKATHEELMDHCVANMPYFAVPRYVEFVGDLPRNAVGRVQKFKLRERGVTPETWDREKAGYVVKR